MLESDKAVARVAKELTTERAASEALKRQVDDAENKQQQLQTRLSSVSSAKEKAVANRKAATEALSALRAEFEAFKSVHLQCAASIKELESELRTANASVTKLEEQLRLQQRTTASESKAASKVAELESALSETTASLDAEKRRANVASDALARSEALVANLRSKCDSLTEELALVKADLRARTAELDDLSSSTPKHEADRRLKDALDQANRHKSVLNQLQDERELAVSRLRSAGLKSGSDLSLLSLIDGVVQELLNVRDELQEQRSQTVMHDGKLSRLQSQCGDLTRKLEAANGEKVACEKTIDDLTNALRVAESAMLTMKQSVADGSRSTVSLANAANKRADAAEAALEVAQDELKAVQQQLLEERSRATALDVTVQQLRDKAQALNSELEMSFARMTELQIGQASAKLTADAMVADKEKLRESYRAKASDSHAAQSMLDAATAQVEQLTQQLGRHEDTIAALRQSCSELESGNAVLVSRLANAETAAAIADEGRRSAETEAAIAVARSNALSAEAEILRNQVKELTARVHDSVTEHTAAQRKLAEVQTSLQMAELKLDSSKSGEKRCGNELEGLRAKVLALTEELGQARVDAQQLQAQLTDLELQLDLERRKRDSEDAAGGEMRSRLEAAHSELMKRGNVIAELQSRLADASAKRDELDIQTRFGAASQKQLENQVEELKQAVAGAEARLVSSVDKIQLLTRSLEDSDDRLAAACRRTEQVLGEKGLVIKQCEDLKRQLEQLSGRVKELQAENKELSELCTAAQNGARSTLVDYVFPCLLVLRKDRVLFTVDMEKLLFL